MKKGLRILFLIILIPVLGIGQARVFINSGYIVMGISGTASAAKPTYFIVHNPAANAITRTGGGFVSEKEWGMVWWDIGAPASTISYTIPFSYNTSSNLPVTVSIATGNGGTASGAGTGTLLFSTWHGTTPNCFSGASDPADNVCYEPSDVTNMYPGTSVSSPTATDDSYYVADRFWVIDAGTGYSTKPSPTITFSYINTAGNSEIAAPNVLTEANLTAQRFNSSLKTWGDWTAGASGVSGVGSGVGTASTGMVVPSANFFRSWVLADNSAPLPIQLTSFNDECDSGAALIKWSTATEVNNDHYTLERSSDGVSFQTIAIVNGAGTNSINHNYSIIDNNPLPGTSYYRLSQTDFDAKTTMLNVIEFTACQSAENTIGAYNANGVINLNINALAADNYTVTLFTVLGQPLLTESHSVAKGNNNIKLYPNVSDAIYILNVKSDKVNFNKKLFIGK